MIVQIELSEQLSEAVSANYQQANYTAVILDAVFLLSEVLRDRTGCESDGAALIGETLGGPDPKLRLTPLRTESDKNVQRGTEEILRGLMRAVRNPRSHKKMEDSKEVADRILALFDYLLEVVNEAKAPFEVSDLIERIQDQHFVRSEDYADLLVSEIPKEKLNDALAAIYEARLGVDAQVLSLVLHSIFGRIGSQERATFVSLMSEDLKTTEDDATIRLATKVFAGEEWHQIARIARLRIEHRLLKSLKAGKYNSTSERCLAGALGTWVQNILPSMETEAQAVHLLTEKLTSSCREEQDYVFNYFFDYLVEYGMTPKDALSELCRDGLSSGDRRYYDALYRKALLSDAEWVTELQPLLNAFEEQPFVEDDDLPF